MPPRGKDGPVPLPRLAGGRAPRWWRRSRPSTTSRPDEQRPRLAADLHLAARRRRGSLRADHPGVRGCRRERPVPRRRSLLHHRRGRRCSSRPAWSAPTSLHGCSIRPSSSSTPGGQRAEPPVDLRSAAPSTTPATGRRRPRRRRPPALFGPVLGVNLHPRPPTGPDGTGPAPQPRRHGDLRPGLDSRGRRRGPGKRALRSILGTPPTTSSPSGAARGLRIGRRRSSAAVSRLLLHVLRRHRRLRAQVMGSARSRRSPRVVRVLPRGADHPCDAGLAPPVRRGKPHQRPWCGSGSRSHRGTAARGPRCRRPTGAPTDGRGAACRGSATSTSRRRSSWPSSRCSARGRRTKAELDVRLLLIDAQFVGAEAVRDRSTERKEAPDAASTELQGSSSTSVADGVASRMDLMTMRKMTSRAPAHPEPADITWEARRRRRRAWPSGCTPRRRACAGRAVVYFHGGGYATRHPRLRSVAASPTWPAPRSRPAGRGLPAGARAPLPGGRWTMPSPPTGS